MCQNCNEIKIKVCKICGEEKPENEFQSGKCKCKLCAWLENRNIDNINDYTKSENLIILDFILNNKIQYLNDLTDILNKPLNNLLINIQKLNIRGKPLTVISNCDVCGKENCYKLTDYINKSNHFCSVNCYNEFQKISFGCKEGNQICSMCNQEKPFNEFHKNNKNKYKGVCKVCSFLNVHKDLKLQEYWSLNEYKIIIDNLLNKKVNCINDLLSLLDGKSIEDVILLLTTDLIISATEIKIKDYCEQCNKEIFRPIAYYLSAEHHFCSKECYDIWQITSVEVPCANCKEPLLTQPNKLIKNKNIFCCHKCSTDFITKQATEVRFCIECGSKFFCLQSSKQKLCSPKCRTDYFSKTYRGENNALYSQIDINCDWCGNEFKTNPSHYNEVENHFCSINCRKQWFKEVYSQTDEFRERARKAALNNLEQGLIPNTRTGIHNIICEYLHNSEINIIEEKDFNFYSIDIYLQDYNLAIEIMGKYWHCDSRIYKTINYESQLQTIKKDKSKHTYFKNKGIEILYLWEDDINNNLFLCSQLIQSYIKNNGILNNYHSFNYEINNKNYLSLNNNIIIPYMDYDISDLNELVDLSVKEKISRKQPETWITFKCEYCGKEKEDRLLHYNSCKNHFCSIDCKSKFENTSVKVNCFNCNKEYKVEQCKYNKNIKFFCCKECEIKYKKPELFNVKCDNCNNEIKVKQIKEHNFCDRNCYDDYRRKHKGEKQEDKWITYNCDQCGKESSKLISSYKNHFNHFCSKECHDMFQKQVITFNCEYCNKETIKTLTDYNKCNHHFCSKSCATSYNNKNRYKKS